MNRALEAHEIAARVDHRSLEDQRAGHLERSQAALEAGEVERASEHTVEAEALDREPRIYMKREDYQRAIKDPGSYAGQLLQQSYEMIGRARDRADNLMREFKELLDRSIDRLDDLLASLRGGGRPAFAAGAAERSADVAGHGSARSSGNDLDAALDALRAAPDPEASAERARQALEEEEQRRAEAREQEIEAAQERERQAQIERERAQEREEPERSVSRDRDDGMDFGL